MWRYLAAILIPRGPRQEGFEFKASLDYCVSKKQQMNNKEDERKEEKKRSSGSEKFVPKLFMC